ncbi:tyrosine-type recombinase/integrase [Streptomyces sp. NPDC059980]|uniref:tyrosine-type recombinase/integrase n=1 Tax=Streptomyces sp. NPDC059980 TaxID=3347022 RepID=UPI0036B0305C
MGAPAVIPLTLLPGRADTSRIGRDRLELLTALIEAPGFDPLFRTTLIYVPPQHPVFAWQCAIEGCERIRRVSHNLCGAHHAQWEQAEQTGQTGLTKRTFMDTATPLPAARGVDYGRCRICPERPAANPATRLCHQHHNRWHRGSAAHIDRNHLDPWALAQHALPGYGPCKARCPFLACTSVGLCFQHHTRYQTDKRPGGAQPGHIHGPLHDGHQLPVTYDDEPAFNTWCATTEPVSQPGLINLHGLPAQLCAEIQWGLHTHAHQGAQHSHWPLHEVRNLVKHCWRGAYTSLTDLHDEGYPGLTRKQSDFDVRKITTEITGGLRCVYNSPSDTKDAGFLETDHFGRRFKNAQSNFDLTAVPQRWLRDLLWDHLTEWLRSPQCPRTRGPFDQMRRAAVELGVFLQADAPEAGHDPTMLHREHAERFVADQRHRARHQLPSLGMVLVDGRSPTVTDLSCQSVFNGARKLLYSAITAGHAERLAIDTGFLTAIPFGGTGLTPRSRNPFSDDVARALTDQTNLSRLDELDRNDRGLRDIWETIVATGRRCSEVVELRLDCIGRYRGLPMLWHDQTKVGNYNEGIRIPEPIHHRLDARRTTTLHLFEKRHGRTPTATERPTLALFPSNVRNPNGRQSISYGHFNDRFKTWIAGLDLGGAYVPHQARHTLATNLLRAGATLTHIRRYLGQLSERMAEHYVKITNSDLEDVLNTVWVAGPGAPTPGKILGGDTTPMNRERALALALDLSRRSTPADGGFCTYQPVVDGGACPWKLDCENCDNFVLSGADLLYWRRKAEQWRTIAENAPDDATADYLHTAFEPTAQAIKGLEQALAALGLLDEALALDLRRPQDYFHRTWSTAFRARDLAALPAPHDRAGQP